MDVRKERNVSQVGRVEVWKFLLGVFAKDRAERGGDVVCASGMRRMST